MTKRELEDRERYPYLDPLPKYDWWDIAGVAGGAVLLLGVGAMAYVLLWM